MKGIHLSTGVTIFKNEGEEWAEGVAVAQNVKPGKGMWMP